MAFDTPSKAVANLAILAQAPDNTSGDISELDLRNICSLILDYAEQGEDSDNIIEGAVNLLLTVSERAKLAAIAAGAEVNPDLVSQAEAEAGTATIERIWSSLRVKQAIAALAGGTSEWSTFSGTRAGGDLIAILGDYDSSDTGLIITLDVANETIIISDDGGLERLELNPSTLVFIHDDGAAKTNIQVVDATSTNTNNIKFPDASGTLATQTYVNDAIQTLDVAFKLDEAGGVTIGEVLYISGSSGTNIEMSLADNTDFTKIEALAVAISTEIDNADMIGRVNGLLVGFNTNSFTTGETLYLSTAGTITNVHPTGVDAVIVIGRAVRIHASVGSVYINIQSHTIGEDLDGTIRHQIVNVNAGANASAAYTMVNDAGHRASISLNSSDIGGTGESMTLFNMGYGDTNNVVDGNKDFAWFTDVTDAHALAVTEKMRLSAAGVLTLLGVDILASLQVHKVATTQVIDCTPRKVQYETLTQGAAVNFTLTNEPAAISAGESALPFEVWIPFIANGVNTLTFTGNFNAELLTKIPSIPTIGHFRIGMIWSYANDEMDVMMDGAQPLVPPAAPSGLTIDAIGRFTMDLSCTDNATSPNDQGYQWQRSLTGLDGSWTTIEVTAVDVVSIVAVGLDSLTEYYFQVKAIHLQLGDSAYSSAVNDTTLASIMLVKDTYSNGAAEIGTRTTVDANNVYLVTGGLLEGDPTTLAEGSILRNSHYIEYPETSGTDFAIFQTTWGLPDETTDNCTMFTSMFFGEDDRVQIQGATDKTAYRVTIRENGVELLSTVTTIDCVANPINRIVFDDTAGVEEIRCEYLNGSTWTNIITPFTVSDDAGVAVLTALAAHGRVSFTNSGNDPNVLPMSFDNSFFTNADYSAVDPDAL